MRGLELLTIVAFIFLLSGTAGAQYWFQTGARGANNAAFNSGAKVSIETVYQNISQGSLGYWVGEDLSNGAFIQVGYEISNQSGDFPTTCSPSGCSNDTFISAGVPTWFWEYFPAGYSGSSFYGGIGQNASAGPAGTFNTYSFISRGDTWYIYFNNNIIGSVNLGTETSGPNPPVAFGEYAGVYTNTTYMSQVEFKNLEFYDGTSFKLVPEAYSYIGYGKGSLSALQNPYGIEEINNYVDKFKVGSGLPLLNHTTLWELGYHLEVSSEYGNLTGSGNYSAYVQVPISAPSFVYIGNGTRMAFTGWVGSGAGSYSGSSNNATVTLNGNVTETAQWQLQYFVNVSNSYGLVTGSGWYDAGARANISVVTNYFYMGAGERLEFNGWSNGLSSQSIDISVNRSIYISAMWQHQYLVNVSTVYGSVKGGGWYDENTTAIVALTEPNISISSTKQEGFYEWSNGSTSSVLSFKVSKPVFVSAMYAPMYLVTLMPVDAYNNSIYNVIYNINGKNYSNNSIYMFSGTDYNIQYVVYKGTEIGINKHVLVNSSRSVLLNLPVYNIEIVGRSFFGTPVNASVSLTFKNGTTISTYTGRNGTLLIKDVPEGYAKGYASLMGIKNNISTSSGSGAYITMLTPLMLAMIVLAITIIGLSGLVADIVEKREKKRKAQAQSKEISKVPKN